MSTVVITCPQSPTEVDNVVFNGVDISLLGARSLHFFVSPNGISLEVTYVPGKHKEVHEYWQCMNPACGRISNVDISFCPICLGTNIYRSTHEDFSEKVTVRP